MIYRVTVKTTGSLQPSGTFWDKEPVYCGDDKAEARTHYLRERTKDYGGSYGNRSRDTIIESFESDPDELDDETAVDSDVLE